MRHSPALLIASLLVPVMLLGAQSVDPSGHWEGSINVPGQPVSVVLDVGKKPDGGYKGTFSNPNTDLRGLPLGGVSVDGRSVRMILKVPQQGGTFVGTLSADDKSITGTYETDEGGYSIPFELKRTADAYFEPPLKNPPIDKELEGTWTGTLVVGQVEKHLVVKMANNRDGTSTGTLLNLDGAQIEIPISIAEKGTSITLGIKVSGAIFSGTFDSAGREIVGTWTQGTFSLPLTLKRAPK
jgi:hypothetical protein